MDNLNFFDRAIVENNESLQSLRIYSIGLIIALVILIAVLVILIIRKKENQDLMSRKKKNTPFAQYHIANPPQPKKETPDPDPPQPQPIAPPQPQPIAPPQPQPIAPPQPEPDLKIRTSPIEVEETSDPHVLEMYFCYDERFEIFM